MSPVGLGAISGGRLPVRWGRLPVPWGRLPVGGGRLLVRGLARRRLLLRRWLLVGRLLRRRRLVSRIGIYGPLKVVHRRPAGYRGSQVAAAVHAHSVGFRHAPLVAPPARGAHHLIHHGG